MRQRISHFAITVREYDEAIDFYCNKLGWELLEDTHLGGEKRWVLVRPPGLPEDTQRAAILLARAATPQQFATIGNQTGGRIFIFVETDDFWRDYTMYLARGVHFVRRPVEEEWGIVAVFQDLYGNRFDLIGLRQWGHTRQM
jgi:catechol 2,3-dioxygenase-like lactoylglutathione lyase family enzyme